MTLSARSHLRLLGRFVTSLSASLPIALGLGALGLGASTAPVLASSMRSPAERTASEVWEIVQDEYLAADFSSSEWQKHWQALVEREYANEATAYRAIQTALTTLDDPYTRFLTPAQFARVRKSAGAATASGLMLSRDDRDRLIVAAPPQLDSAAAAAGLQQGDAIVAIDNVRTASLDASEAAGLMRVAAGQWLALDVERGERTLTLNLRGTDIDERTDVFSAVRHEGDRAIGYLRITQFGAKTADRVRSAIASLEREGVNAYVLDLRSNAGGRIDASTKIADMFLAGGAIATVEGREGILKHYEADSKTLTDKPLALLVDSGTASSSELLAAALQDRERATAIGARTFGKGIVQSIYTMPDNSCLSITIARYRTPDGHLIHERGLAPDRQVELSDRDRQRLSQRQDLVATAADPQYAAAVSSLVGQESDFGMKISSSN
ncbi:MAG: S41 family peptidase [Cyanobacteria bacterium P01_D01_bin.123]